MTGVPPPKGPFRGHRYGSHGHQARRLDTDGSRPESPNRGRLRHVQLRQALAAQTMALCHRGVGSGGEHGGRLRREPRRGSVARPGPPTGVRSDRPSVFPPAATRPAGALRRRAAARGVGSYARWRSGRSCRSGNGVRTLYAGRWRGRWLSFLGRRGLGLDGGLDLDLRRFRARSRGGSDRCSGGHWTSPCLTLELSLGLAQRLAHRHCQPVSDGLAERVAVGIQHRRRAVRGVGGGLRRG